MPLPPNSPLPKSSGDRKAVPLTTGVLDYFPAALAAVAKVSVAGNEKHNPGEPLHHARSKSTDHADSIARHLLERGGFDPDTGQRHSAELAWRALANLQQELEEAGEAPLARGARPPADAGMVQFITPPRLTPEEVRQIRKDVWPTHSDPAKAPSKAHWGGAQ